MYPLLEKDGPHHLPILSYVSCSSDNTIRFWNHTKGNLFQLVIS